MDDVYLDNNATTKPHPDVRAAMLMALDCWYGNPSSKHELGTASRSVIEDARRAISVFIGAGRPSDVLFLSGATEAIAQAFESARKTVQQVATSAIEHTAVLAAATAAERCGVAHFTIPVSTDGQISLRDLDQVVRKAPTFVSVTLVNNETGTLQDISGVAEICRQHGALLHVDAAQAIGRVHVDVSDLGCDYLSLSPHKFHGPKGVGALFVRSEAPKTSIIHGHQEFGLRGGTENLPGIAGTAAAVRALHDWQARLPTISKLTHRLEQGILAEIPGAAVNCVDAPRVANTSNIYFPKRSAADMVASLSRRGVYVSAGAACSTGGSPSHVLEALGYGRTRANSSIRFSPSRFSTPAEIESAIRQTKEVYSATLASA
jgi:cysteine desulfurase